MASEDLRLITRVELEPVVDILTFLRDAQSLASTLIADTEAEYQYLRNSEWPDTGEIARRFYYLRWQRVALHEFINHQALVTQRLREQAGLEEADLITTSEEEEDVIISDTATAA